MKGQHGGAGRGQGRHKVLDFFGDRINVGAEFDRRWREAQEVEARQKHEDIRKNVDVEQEIDDLQKARRKTTFPFCAFHISNRLDNIGRRLSLPLKRPKGETERITEEVIEWFKKKHGAVITANQVDECVIEYRRFLRDSKSPT